MTGNAGEFIRSIQVGTPATYESEDLSDPMDRPWETDFFKDPVGTDYFLVKTDFKGPV